MPETSTLAILAGAGAFPAAVAEAARANGRPVFLLLLKGIADKSLERYPHVWVGIGQIGRIFSEARGAEARDIVMIGSLVRPNLLTTIPDFGALRHIPRFMRLYRGGDDHLLSGIGKLFESEGFRLVGAHEVAPDLLMPVGLMGDRAPSETEREDITVALCAIAALGPYDVGQAVVIADRRIVAVEGAEGTDGLLERVTAMRAAGRIRWTGTKGVLVKAPKPGQDRRIDLPAIGPATIERATEAGLSGVAVAGGSTLVVEPQRLIAAADARGLFVLGVETRGQGI